MLLHYLTKYANTKIAFFHSSIVVTAFPEIDQFLFDFFNFVNLQLIFMLLQGP